MYSVRKMIGNTLAKSIFIWFNLILLLNFITRIVGISEQTNTKHNGDDLDMLIDNTTTTTTSKSNYSEYEKMFNRSFINVGLANNVNSMNGMHLQLNAQHDFWLYEKLMDLYAKVTLFRQVYIYMGTGITCVGFILNTLCIVIFYKSKLFRNSSFPYYVYVISVVDTVNIFLRFLVPQSYEIYVRNRLANFYKVNRSDFNLEKYENYTPKVVNDYDCNIYLYTMNSLTLVSVWLMVAVSLERLIVIKFTLQSKYWIKVRAIIILVVIFVTIFSLNIFDMAPGFYTKPVWFANLTLLCERDDIKNETTTYKRIGGLAFDTNLFALTRTLFQTIVPFLFVFIFNSLIVYNFKQIKSTALSYGKSNSCVSVASGASYSGLQQQQHQNSSQQTSANKHKQASLSPNEQYLSPNQPLAPCSYKKRKSTFRQSKKNSLNQNRSQLQIPNIRRRGSSHYKYNSSSSRSPSPAHTLSIPATPTSLMSALNLAQQQQQQQRPNTLSSPAQGHLSPTAPTTPTTEMTITTTTGAVSNPGTVNVTTGQNKQYSTSFLMPPTALSTSMLNNSTNTHNDSTTQSIGTTNSSANLSITTTTTAGVGGLNKSNNLSASPLHISPSSLTAPSPHHHNHSHRVSFKRRASRMKLNRETDIMLIVLSFSILLSQLPCTIAWYLIYYRNILSTRDLDLVFVPPRVLIFLYIMRLVEMVYFSLNFFFYITLSPSLRREIKNYPFETMIKNFIFLKKSSAPSNNAAATSTAHHGRFAGTKNGGPGAVLQPLASKQSPTSHTKQAEFYLDANSTSSPNKQHMRLCSNSSCEYIEYIDRLRSISPLRRPNFLLKPNSTPTRPSVSAHTAKFDDDDNNNKAKTTAVENEPKLKKSKLIRNFFTNKASHFKRQKTNNNNNPNSINANSTGKMLNDKNSRIKIIINNLYDEEEELKIDDDIIVDNYSNNEQPSVSHAGVSQGTDKAETAEKSSYLHLLSKSNWSSSSILSSYDRKSTTSIEITPTANANPTSSNHNENSNVNNNQVAYL